jgi:hypothetical protein
MMDFEVHGDGPVGSDRRTVTRAALDRLEARVAKAVADVIVRFDQLLAERDRRYDERAKAQQALFDLAHAAAKEAVNKAETAADSRFHSLNEFRAHLGDQQRSLIPRIEAEQRMSALEKRIDAVEGQSLEFRSSAKGGRETLSYLVATISLLLAIAAFVYEKVGR